MRATAIVTGLGLVLAACGGEKKPEPAAEAGRAAPPAAPAATAATHVQRILHKTRLHNRRDLMLLQPRKSAA